YNTIVKQALKKAAELRHNRGYSTSRDDISRRSLASTFVEEENKQVDQHQPHKEEKLEELIHAQKLVLSSTDKATIDTETMIQREKLDDLHSLETDMSILADSYKDLMTIMKDQQVDIDMIEQNVDKTANSVEKGVVDIKVVILSSCIFIFNMVGKEVS